MLFGLRRLLNGIANAGANVNPAPILILGNQKSGTSAIAHLLADYAGLSKTVDIPEVWWPTLRDLLSGKETLNALAERYPLPFSRELIKEPGLTFMYDQLVAVHPHARIVYVVRDPRSHMRSMLNRMGLPGSLVDLNVREYPIHATWAPLFSNELASLLELGSGNYIERLAMRWNVAADTYLSNEEDMLLLRYEDFVADKLGSIRRIAEQLNLSEQASIADQVHVQYQPRGDRQISWREFFGRDNLSRIEEICADPMRQLGYAPEPGWIPPK